MRCFKNSDPNVALWQETVSQCHSEALAEESRLCNSRKCEMLRFAQHDIDEVASIAAESPRGILGIVTVEVL